MMFARRQVLAGVAAKMVLLPAFGAAARRVTTPEQRRGTVVHNQGMPDAMQAFAYGFCMSLRNYRTDGPIPEDRADELRKHYLDPHYLDEHGMTEGTLPMVTEPFKDVYDMGVSDDFQTIACVAATEEKKRELFLFRVGMKEGKPYSIVYVTPTQPPAPENGFFEPWTLRMTL